MKDMDIRGYDDIIGFPHHVSATHPHMPIPNRAAQFAPFAALTGHDAAVKETARLTEERRELDDDIKGILDEKLRMVQEMLPVCQPQVAVTYFCPDARKAGGCYMTVSGKIKKVDAYGRSIMMEDNLQIPIGEIYGIEFIADEAGETIQEHISR